MELENNKQKTKGGLVNRRKLRGTLNDLFEELDIAPYENMSHGNLELQCKEEAVYESAQHSKRTHNGTTVATLKSSSRKSTPTKLTPLSLIEHKENKKNPQTEGKVLKLFDRRVDMSKFNEHTPLYPILRAWFQNRPGDSIMQDYTQRQVPPNRIRMIDGAELWDKVRRNEITEIYELPRPCDTDLSLIPPPLPPARPQNTATIDAILHTCSIYQIGGPELMNQHKLRWRDVRQAWLQHTTKYRHERFKYSYLILQHLHKRQKLKLMLEQRKARR